VGAEQTILASTGLGGWLPLARARSYAEQKTTSSFFFFFFLERAYPRHPHLQRGGGGGGGVTKNHHHHHPQAVEAKAPGFKTNLY